MYDCSISSCHRRWYYFFWVCFCQEIRFWKWPIKNTYLHLERPKWFNVLQDFIDCFIGPKRKNNPVWFWCWTQILRYVIRWNTQILFILPQLKNDAERPSQNQGTIMIIKKLMSFCYSKFISVKNINFTKVLSVC